MALLALTSALLVSSPAAGAWKATERVETYTVTGSSGIELYRSIGERGPKVGLGRTIAVTRFKLTWKRDYQVRDGACVLATAVPTLTITYHLPKAKSGLPEPTRTNWQTFIAGVEAHERVHGQQIKDMVGKIEAYTVGLTVPDDPQCKKIRQQMQVELKALSDAQRAASRDFDQVELNEGGNVHQLVLMLVNGG